MARLATKKPQSIWGINVKKTDAVDIDGMTAVMLPPDQLMVFNVNKERAPLLFTAPLHAILYLTDNYQMSYQQAAAALVPAEQAFDPAAAAYVGMPQIMAVTCGCCGATVTQNNIRTTNDGRTTLVCPNCGKDVHIAPTARK